MKNKIMWIKIFKITIFSLVCLALSINSIADGGMYPVNQLNADKLKTAGLKIPLKEIYNPDGVSLMQAVVSLGGCTGSFVSEDGLILTNHHCVFGALASLSSVSNNIMENGFVSASREKEIPLKEMTVKIMLSYDDVSEKVLKDVENIIDPLRRREMIAQNIQNILSEEKIKNPTLSIELAEMLTGKSYMIIRYQFLKDVRLVYVPPREIGEFGGETDNWMWPRHSGDFSFIRAYVGPDGSPASFSQQNVPFKPAKFIKINTNGVAEQDFIFIIGYPGRTFRNRPSAYLNFSEKVQMPFIADFFEYRISEMTRLSKLNDEWKVKFDPQIKSLANTSKNYRGKLKSLAAIKLYEEKKKEENNIIALLNNQPVLAIEFKSILNSFDSLYALYNVIGLKNLWYSQFFNVSPNFEIARLIVNYYYQYLNSNGDQKKLKPIFDKTVGQIESILPSAKSITDSIFIKKLFYLAEENNQVFPWFNKYFRIENEKLNVNNYIINIYSGIFKDLEEIKKIMSNPDKILKSKNPFIKLVVAMIEDIQETSVKINSLNSTIDALLPRYIELKMEASGSDFIPDANSTFRFTYGYIRGYSPSDGVYYSPFTSLIGIPEKISLGGEYKICQPLIEAIDNTAVKVATAPEMLKYTVNFLYNADTTGGNSGSPVLNAYGELVGLNFDRTYEATINDFAWNESYSRSIGVDIRYILFVVREVNQSKSLLEELGAI